MTADESANSLVMTDTQENIHHIMEVVNALDTVTSGNSAIPGVPSEIRGLKSFG